MILPERVLPSFPVHPLPKSKVTVFGKVFGPFGSTVIVKQRSVGEATFSALEFLYTILVPVPRPISSPASEDCTPIEILNTSSNCCSASLSFCAASIDVCGSGLSVSLVLLSFLQEAKASVPAKTSAIGNFEKEKACFI